MNKVLFIFASLLLEVSLSIGQSVECVSCKGNIVDFIKIASAIGEKNTSNGMYSFAGGKYSEATGDYSLAFGYTTKATGPSTFALGYQSQALGMYSVSIGRQSIVNGDGSFAIGLSNIAQAGSSYLFGELLRSNASGSITIGFGASLNNYLINNKANSMMVGFKSIYPTLFIEGKTSTNNDKTGKVGIGNITTPTAKLHIKADNDEHASLKLEPTGSAYYAQIILGNSGQSIYTKANEDLKFTTQSGKNFVFENGKVVTSGLLISTGYALGKLLQSDVYGNAIWTSPAWTISGSDVYRTTGNVGIGTTPTSNRLEVSGTVQATSFIGNGSGLTNIPGDNLGNHIATQNLQMNGKWLSGDGGNEGVFVKNDGNVGIGTMNPVSQLDISKNISNGGKVGMRIINDGYFPWFIGINHDDYSLDNSFIIADYNQMNSDPFLVIKNNGKIGIGTDDIDQDYLVNINGKILAEELKIILNVPSSDHVFNKDYDLIPIQDLEKYITGHKHLPEIPSAAEFKANGYEVGKMDDLLLRKVEELTLYIIAQQKEIEMLKELTKSSISITN
jgi:hypothetical protein